MKDKNDKPLAGELVGATVFGALDTFQDFPAQVDAELEKLGYGEKEKPAKEITVDRRAISGY